jgi:hypothetical protein
MGRLSRVYVSQQSMKIVHVFSQASQIVLCMYGSEKEFTELDD